MGGCLLLVITLLGFLSVPLRLHAETLILNPRKVKELLLTEGIGVKRLHLNLSAKKEELPIVRSRFDTFLTLSGDHTIDKSARTSTFFGTRTDTTHWNAALDKLIPTGTTLGVHFLNERSRSFGANAITGLPNNPTYEPTMEFQLKQSLGKNFAGSVDRHEVERVKKAVAALDYQTQHEVNKLIVEAELLYWRWVTAREGVQIGREALLAAEDFLRITKDKEALGTVEKTDRLGATALVAKRRALLAELQDNLNEKIADLKTLLNLPKEIDLKPNDYASGAVTVSENEALRLALEGRFDLLGEKKSLEEQEIRLIIAKRGILPTIDFENTLKLNEVSSVGDYYTAAAGMDSPNWKVGVNFKFPLENREARGFRNQTRFQKTEALLKVRQMEQAILQDVTQKYRAVALAREAWKALQSAVTSEGEKLTYVTEQYMRARYDAQIILKSQEDYLDARQKALESKLRLATAVLALREGMNKGL